MTLLGLFPSIWLTTDPPKRGLPIKKHRGELCIDANGIRFTSADYRLAIASADLEVVGFGRAGNDWVNSWVHVNFTDESGQSGEAYLSDGSLAGWGGIFGGAKRLDRALREVAA